MNLQKHLAWIDLEMTGLDFDRDVILEIAVIITDQNLRLVAHGPELVIYQSPENLQGMANEVYQMHNDSGLLLDVSRSQITIRQAEAQVLNFLKQYSGPGQMPLCGNSIWQDKFFLRRFMPNLLNFLHYRIIDVSTVKELVTGWYGAPEFKKSKNHRALADIQESIAELQYYRENYFINL